ncbi:MAG TPA: amino acid aminotransferase [Sphingobium sp.]
MSETVLDQPSAFPRLDRQAPDALLGLITLYKRDERPEKVDLGVGVYRDETGLTPIMQAVKAAEARLWQDQATKSYLGAEGDAAYTQLLAQLVFGPAIAASDGLTGVQTPGGTGALRLGAELIARARPDATVWIGTPTWPNHGPIFERAGLRTQLHRFYVPGTSSIDFEGMMADLVHAKPGDILLIHGCCHNPTGADFSEDQWADLVTLCDRSAVIPFIDLAYQGLGDDLDADASATRALLKWLPNALVAYSCDKNFGLYRERVGAFWFKAASPAMAEIARSNLLLLARSLWSMPPDHGAAIVRTILETPELSADWRLELSRMRVRINDLRRALAAGHPALTPIAEQRGMFAMLPISGEAVIALREERGIYMAGNGRINICGLTLSSIDMFLDGLRPYLPNA